MEEQVTLQLPETCPFKSLLNANSSFVEVSDDKTCLPVKGDVLRGFVNLARRTSAAARRARA